MTNEINKDYLKADAILILSGIVANPNAYLSKPEVSVAYAIAHVRDLDKQIDDLVNAPARRAEAEKAQAKLTADRAEAEAKEAEAKAKQVRDAADAARQRAEVSKTQV